MFLNDKINVMTASNENWANIWIKVIEGMIEYNLSYC